MPPMSVHLGDEYVARKEGADEQAGRKTRQRPAVLGPIPQAQQEAFAAKEKELGLERVN